MQIHEGFNVLGRYLTQYNMEDNRQIVVKVFDGSRSGREDFGLYQDQFEFDRQEVLELLKSHQSQELNDLLVQLLEDKVQLSQGTEREDSWEHAWIDLELSDRYIQIIKKKWRKASWI